MPTEIVWPADTFTCERLPLQDDPARVPASAGGPAQGSAQGLEGEERAGRGDVRALRPVEVRAGARERRGHQGEAVNLIAMSRRVARVFFNLGIMPAGHFEDVASAAVVGMVEAQAAGKVSRGELYRAGNTAARQAIREAWSRGLTGRAGGALQVAPKVTGAPLTLARLPSSSVPADVQIEALEVREIVEREARALIPGTRAHGLETRRAVVEWRWLSDEPLTMDACAERLGLGAGLPAGKRHAAVWIVERRLQGILRERLRTVLDNR